MRTGEPSSTGHVEAFPDGRLARAALDASPQPALQRRPAVSITVRDRDGPHPSLDPIPRMPGFVTAAAYPGNIEGIATPLEAARVPMACLGGSSLNRAATRALTRVPIRAPSRPSSVTGAGLRLLLVDDDVVARHKVAETLETLLDASIHSVGSAKGALDAVMAERFDAIILEVGLPDGDGCELCAAIRRRGLAAPIVMLTRLGQADDVMRGLDAGAHDYVVKPFRPYEFAARVRAQLRLFEASDDVQVWVGDQLFHSGKRTLSEPGRSHPVQLTVKEAALLRYLHRANGGVVSRKELLHHVWEYSERAETNTVASHLYSLRRKMQPRGGSPRILVSEPGGYRLLRTEITEARNAAPKWPLSDLRNPFRGDAENPATPATVTPRPMPMRLSP